VRAAPDGPSAIVTAHRPKQPVGARVYYTLSTPAAVRFRIERIVTGRLDRRRRCESARRRLAIGTRCTRYLLLASAITINGRAGENSFELTGRLNRRKLSPGSYRLRATPYAGHQPGSSASADFRIVR
jgi:hypothetical protein